MFSSQQKASFIISQSEILTNIWKFLCISSILTFLYVPFLQSESSTYSYALEHSKHYHILFANTVFSSVPNMSR